MRLSSAFAIERRALVVLKDPPRRLAVPHQRVPDDEHLVLLAECHVLVRPLERITVRPRMHGLPFQDVLRADRVELRLDDRAAARILVAKLRLVDRRANAEDSLGRRPSA